MTLRPVARNEGEFGVEGSFFALGGGVCEGAFDCAAAQLSGDCHRDTFDKSGSTGDGFCNFDSKGDAATFSVTGCAVQQVRGPNWHTSHLKMLC